MALIRRLGAAYLRWRQRRALWRTGFWCERHWAVIRELGADHGIATRNIAAGLAIVGTGYKPVKNACCVFTDETVRGVLELSRRGPDDE